jgi:RNA polymerase sigma-70 factor (ECF subfamily)
MNNELFDKIYEENYKDLLKFSISINTDVDNAKDSVQESFVRLLKQEKLWTNPRAWLFTVCRNVSYKKFRKTNRLCPLDEEDNNSKESECLRPDEFMVNFEDKNILKKSLLELNERQRQIINLRFFSNLSYEEIGKQMNLKSGNVGFILHVAIKKLKKQFNLNNKEPKLQLTLQ